MSKKDNIPAGVRAEFDDVDYWHELIKSGDMVTLPNGKRVTIYEWMKKFMHESYGNNFSRKNPENNILQTEDQKKWARRNNNNTNRDALNVAKKSGMYVSYDLLAYKQSKAKIDEDWQDSFKREGLNTTLNKIINETCDKLNIKFNKNNAWLLIELYLAINKFIRMVRKDKRNG